MENINDILKKKRKEKGLTLKEVSEKSGIYIELLKDIEEKNVALTPEFLIRLSDVLDLKLSRIMRESGFDWDLNYIKKRCSVFDKKINEINGLKRRFILFIFLGSISLILCIVLGIIHLYNEELLWGSIFIFLIALNSHTITNNIFMLEEVKGEKESLIASKERMLIIYNRIREDKKSVF